jgi:hypothetical protein
VKTQQKEVLIVEIETTLGGPMSIFLRELEQMFKLTRVIINLLQVVQRLFTKVPLASSFVPWTEPAMIKMSCSQVHVVELP